MNGRASKWCLVATALAMLVAACEQSVTETSDPEASVSAQSLTFAAEVEQQTFEISNTGGTTLHWSIAQKPDWLTLVPSSGSVRPDESTTVTTIANRAGLGIGDVTGTLVLSVSSDQASVSVDLSLNVPEAAILQVFATLLEFDYFDDSIEFNVGNAGNEPLVWSSSSEAAYLTLTPDSGTLQPSETISVTLSVDRTDLETDTHQATLTISGGASQTASVGISVKHFREDLWRLNHLVVDAEYDRNNDVIITVSDGPARLNVLDPEAQTIQSLDLALAPSSVSIHPDGNSAAVGHNGFLSLVDLTTLTVTQVYNVSADIFDIVLATNGWAYAMPGGGGWSELRCIELATGIESASTGGFVNPGTVMRLHPSGDYIYGADNGISPSDAEKYDIRGGVAVYMYDSPYHGDFAFSGNLWLNDAGTKMFTRSSNVFRLSDIQNEDMIYDGQLPEAYPIEALAHSASAGRLIVIQGGTFSNDPIPEVRVYSDDFFVFQESRSMPQFFVPGNPSEDINDFSFGQFVFTNAAGTRFYVLAKSHEDLGPTMWAIFSDDTTSTP